MEGEGRRGVRWGRGVSIGDSGDHILSDEGVGARVEALRALYLSMNETSF